MCKCVWVGRGKGGSDLYVPCPGSCFDAPPNPHIHNKGPGVALYPYPDARAWE